MLGPSGACEQDRGAGRDADREREERVADRYPPSVRAPLKVRAAGERAAGERFLRGCLDEDADAGGDRIAESSPRPPPALAPPPLSCWMVMLPRRDTRRCRGALPAPPAWRDTSRSRASPRPPPSPSPSRPPPRPPPPPPLRPALRIASRLVLRRNRRLGAGEAGEGEAAAAAAASRPADGEARASARKSRDEAPGDRRFGERDDLPLRRRRRRSSSASRSVWRSDRTETGPPP